MGLERCEPFQDSWQCPFTRAMSDGLNFDGKAVEATSPGAVDGTFFVRVINVPPF